MAAKKETRAKMLETLLPGERDAFLQRPPAEQAEIVKLWASGGRNPVDRGERVFLAASVTADRAADDQPIPRKENRKGETVPSGMMWDSEARELVDSGAYGDERQMDLAKRWEIAARTVHEALGTALVHCDADTVPSIDGEEVGPVPRICDPYTTKLLEDLATELDEPWRARLRSAFHWAALMRVQETAYARKVKKRSKGPRLTERNLRIALLGDTVPNAQQVVIATLGRPDPDMLRLVERVLPRVQARSDPTRGGGRDGGLSVNEAVELVALGLRDEKALRKKLATPR